MPYVLHYINALIDLDPEKAKEEILNALREAKMHRADAADLIGCNPATLFRWIARLGIEDEVAALDERARNKGWIHDKKGGRPPSRKKNGRPRVTPG